LECPHGFFIALFATISNQLPPFATIWELASGGSFVSLHRQSKWLTSLETLRLNGKEILKSLILSLLPLPYPLRQHQGAHDEERIIKYQAPKHRSQDGDGGIRQEIGIIQPKHQLCHTASSHGRRRNGRGELAKHIDAKALT